MIRKIKVWLLRNLYNAIVIEDVITIDTGKIRLNGKEITKNELQQFQAEIKALEGFRIWSIMTNSLEYIAQDKIFNRAETFNHVELGKMMLYCLSVQKDITKIIKART